MKKIGIVPQADLLKTDNMYDDKYHFVNTYIQRVTEVGALPVGVLPVNGRIQTQILEECDAFILQGGKGIYGYQLDVIDYAVKHGKKILGICLGCQSVHTYFAIKEEIEANGWKESIADYYVMKKAEGATWIDPVADHRFPSLPRVLTDTVKHSVLIEKGTHLYEILGKEEIPGASFHSFCIGTPSKYETVSGRAKDGTIEAVEVGDKIIGTQFHPDVDSKTNELFVWLTK